MYGSIPFLLLFFFVLRTSSVAQDQVINWQFIKSKGDISIYKRDYGKNGIHQFRLTTVFKNTSFSGIYACFRDFSSFDAWQGDLKEVKNLKKNSDLDNIDYYKFGFPWPFADRDGIFNQKISFDETGQQMNINFNTIYNFVPIKEPLTRIKEAVGWWKFKKLANGDILVEYVNYSDPDNISGNIVNLIFTDALIQTLMNLKKHVQDEKFKNKKFPFIKE